MPKKSNIPSASTISWVSTSYGVTAAAAFTLPADQYVPVPEILSVVDSRRDLTDEAEVP